MMVGGICKRASHRAATQSITRARKTLTCPQELGSALQRDGIVAVLSTSAWTIIADTSLIVESADRWINLAAFRNSSASNDELQQQHLRGSLEARRSVIPSKKIECEVCCTSSRTTICKPLGQQVITKLGGVRRRDYYYYYDYDLSRPLWGSVQRRDYFHTEGGAAAGLESLSSVHDRIDSTTAGVINPKHISEEGFKGTSVVNAEGQAAVNECQEIFEESKEVGVHLHPTATAQRTLGHFQTLDLPKIENPTAIVVKKVCSILDIQEWNSDTSKTLEDANLVITPFLIQQIIQRMSSKNVDVTWNFFKWAREKASRKISVRAHIAILDALGHAKEFGTMKQAFALVLEDGHRKSAWPYNNALKWCTAAENAETALYFWSKMKENNCTATVVTYNRLIDLFARQGNHQESLEIFRQMLKANCPPNISTYNALMYAFGVAGQPEVAESLFDRLSELGCRPNYSTYNNLISLHGRAGNPGRALKYISMMKAAGMDVGDDVNSTLHMSLPRVKAAEEMASQEKAGTEDQLRTFVIQPDILSSLPGISTGRIIGPSSLVKLLEKGEPLSVETKLENIKPLIHPQFVVQVLQRLKNPHTAMKFFDWAKDQPHFKHNEYSYSMMISILGRSRNNESLDRILKEMQEQGIGMNTAIFTALITCYGRANDLEGALKVFRQMKEWGCKPDIVTYTSLIHLLAKHGSYEPAVNMFEEMKQAGIAPNMHTYSVMIYNLIKAGKVTEAVSMLKAMPDLGYQPSSITFATIINHCAKEGQVEIAKNLYSQMEVQGIKPLRKTMTVLEAAFRKAGLTEDADRIIEKSRSRRFWDETFKSSTEKVAHELLFKDFAEGEASRHPGSIRC